MVAEAFVKIGANLSPLKSGLSKAKGLLKGGIGLAFKAAAVAATVGVAAITAAIAGGIGLVKLGSDLEEMQGKFDAVFKEQAGAAEAFSTDLAKGVGRSRVEIKGFMSELQDLFVPMGFSREQALGLSKEVTALGIDLASFNNMTDAEAIEKLNAGLTGSHEVLKSFGVFINDNTLSLKLQELGLAKNAQVATEQAKAMARLQIIMESTTDAQGDAARTSGGLANQWKRLKGNLFDLASTIGASLIPAAQQVVAVFSGMAGWADTNKDKVSGFAQTLSGGLGQAIEFVKGIVARLVAVWQANWAVMGETITAVWNFIIATIGGAVTTIISFYVSFIEWIGQLQRSIFQFAGMSGGAFTEFGNSVNGVFASMKEIAISVFATIKEWVEAIIFTFLNWDLVTEKLGVKIAQAFENIKLRIINFAQNVVELFSWIGSNWQDILFTALDAMLTAMINYGKNVRKVLSALWEAIKTGSTAPFDNIDFTPILEGAANTISNMPDFKPFVETDAFNGQLDGIDKEWEKRAERWRQTMEDNAPDIGEAAGEGAQDEIDKKTFKMPPFDPKKFDIEGTVKGKGGKSDAGSFKGLAAVWKDVQGKLLKGDEDLKKKGVDLQEKQLAETKKQTEAIVGMTTPVASFG